MPMSMNSAPQPATDTLISYQVLTGAASSFTQVASIPSKFKYLRILVKTKTTGGGGTLTLNLNGDAGANYNNQNLNCTSTTITGSIGAGSYISLGPCEGSTKTTVAFAIVSQDNVFYKMANVKSGFDGNVYSGANSWNNTAYITSVDVAVSAGTMAIGSELQIWGIS